MEKTNVRSFSWRGFVSVTTGLTFLGLAVTGIVLFFTPPGRIANWGGWDWLALSKYQWAGLHIYPRSTVIRYPGVRFALNPNHCFMSPLEINGHMRSAINRRIIAKALFDVDPG